MKKLLIIFGILDFLAIIKAFDTISTVIKNGTTFYWMNIILLILYASLFVSGFFLIKRKNIGIWIYYIQFPFRLMFLAGLSFGFILLASRLFNDNEMISRFLLIFCIVLEVARLLTTIFIHKKLSEK